MAAKYITRDGDMIDRIAWKYYGSTALSVVENIFLANPNLAELGPVLPENLTITLPDIPKPAQQQGVRLWD